MWDDCLLSRKQCLNVGRLSLNKETMFQAGCWPFWLFRHLEETLGVASILLPLERRAPSDLGFRRWLLFLFTPLVFDFSNSKTALSAGRAVSDERPLTYSPGRSGIPLCLFEYPLCSTGSSGGEGEGGWVEMQPRWVWYSGPPFLPC